MGVSLAPPEKVRKLQETLHAKAKRAPTYRFYALYDKLYRFDVLNYAYSCCQANEGAAGVDGQTFDDIAAYGLVRWLSELAEPALGSVSGWGGSSRCREPNGHATRNLTCADSGSSGLRDDRATSRGRRCESLSESRMREICTSASMSGRWKRGMGRYSGTGNRKGRQHARLP